MKKRLLLLLFTALSLLPLHAYDFEADGIYYNITGDNTCSVTYRDESCNSYSGDVVIPESVIYSGTEYSIKEIGYGAFFVCSGLTSVAIPNSVAEIGGWAFSYCRGLTSITIPNSVEKIGACAFHYCEGLKSVTMSNSVTEIGASAFVGCRSLMDFYINHSLITHDKVIDGITYSCSLEVYDGVLYESLTDPAGENVKHLLQYPEGKTNETFTIPNNVTQIRPYAFAHAEKLTSVTIPNSVAEIGAAAFQECSGLTSISIPNSVKKIGVCAFQFCGGLKSVTIPNSVTEIGYGAFACCRSLTDLYVDPLNSHDKLIDGITYKCAFEVYDGVLYESLTDSTGENVKHLLQYPAGKTNETFNIPNDVTQISHYAFMYSEKLTSVTIPNSVTEIGWYAFSDCSGLTSVTIPNSVTEICGYTFGYCSSLTSVEIPNSVTEIGDEALSHCSSLTSVEIPNSVTEIGEGTFWYCSSLISVTIPNSVTEIGNNAFYGCSGLTSVTYLAESPIESYISLFSNEIYEKATLNYLESATEKIESTTPWNKFVNRIGRSADFVDTKIEEISGGSNEITEVYNLSGVKVGDSLNGLPKGIYIVRQGGKTTKVAI